MKELKHKIYDCESCEILNKIYTQRDNDMEELVELRSENAELKKQNTALQNMIKITLQKINMNSNIIKSIIDDTIDKD